jgi:hypothetical protein
MTDIESLKETGGSIADYLGDAAGSVKNLIGDYAPSAGLGTAMAGTGIVSALLSALVNAKEKPRKGESRAERRSRITRNALTTGVAGAGGVYGLQKGFFDDKTGLLSNILPEAKGTGQRLWDTIKSTLDPTKLDDRLIAGGTVGGLAAGGAALTNKLHPEAFKPGKDSGRIMKALISAINSTKGSKGYKLPAALGLTTAFLPELSSVAGMGVGGALNLGGDVIDNLTSPASF